MGMASSSSVLVDNSNSGSCGSGCGCGTTAPAINHHPLVKNLLSILSVLGYSASAHNSNAVNIAERIDGKVYNIVMLVSENDRELVTTCKVGDLSSIGENVETQRDFLFACVNANDVLAPFAVSLITSEDDSSVKSGEADIVLICRSISFYATSEPITALMNALRKAVIYYNQNVCSFIPSSAR